LSFKFSEINYDQVTIPAATTAGFLMQQYKIIVCFCSFQFCLTDVGEDLLNLCKRNVSLNKHMIEPSGKMTFSDWSISSFSSVEADHGIHL